MWLLNGKHGQHLRAKNKICKTSQHSLSISGRENWQIASWYSKEFCASVLTPCEHDTKMVLLKKSTRVNYLISSLYKLIVDFINYFFRTWQCMKIFHDNLSKRVRMAEIFSIKAINANEPNCNMVQLPDLVTFLSFTQPCEKANLPNNQLMN